MDNKYKPAQVINKDAQAVLQVDADRHAEQLQQVSSLEGTVVALANQFIKHVGKTNVVNLSDINTGSIVTAVNKLGSTVDSKYLELKPIAEGLRDLLHAMADNKKTPAVELHFDKGINPAGSYKKGKSYRAGDAVSFEGAVYIAKQDTQALPTDETWLLLVPKGDQGEQGMQGLPGERGDRGERGPAGKDGLDGATGERGPIGLQGPEGQRGETGKPGERGEKGDQGERGPQGQGWRGIPGVGVPEGGTTGQILAKNSNTDHDTEWIDNTGGASVSDTAYGASWNGVTDVAPSKNAVYDKIETIAAGSGITRTVTVSSGNFTAGSSASIDYVYILNGAHTPTLPTAAGNTNRYTFKNAHSANISFNTTAAQTVDGGSLTIAPAEAVDLISDGTNWRII